MLAAALAPATGAGDGTGDKPVPVPPKGHEHYGMPVLDFDRPVQEADRVWRALGADGVDTAMHGSSVHDSSGHDPSGVDTAGEGDGPTRWATDRGWVVEDIEDVEIDR